MSYMVETVLGAVDVKNLGRILTHEHLSANCDKPNLFYTPPPEHLKSLQIGGHFEDDSFTLENSGLFRQYPYSNHNNIRFNDEATHQVLLDEVELFKNAGGGTIVENTSHGLGRNLDVMVKTSRASGVHIIAGSGFYVHPSQAESILASSVESLTQIVRTDMTVGCPEMSGVKCGVIAEVGSIWPITDFERKAIVATAIVQAEIGCGVSFHPGRDSEAPGEIARIYLEAGGDKDKAVMSHLDRTIQDKEGLLEFAKTSGFYCQFDLFGIETSMYQLKKSLDMPSDAQRIDRIKWLLEDGHRNKILMSHDIHTKHRLVKFGGHGYGHLLHTVAPQMFDKGIDQDTIDHLLTTNPQTWLGVSSNYQPRITLA